MRPKQLFVACVFTSLFCVAAHAQDAPLGDLVRQQKQEKAQAAKSDPASAAKPKVITNADLPSSTETDSLRTKPSASPSVSSTPSLSALDAASVKAQIIEQKNHISSLGVQISQLSESIHFASAGCVYNCVQWNERQQQKIGQVEALKSQLDDANKRLESMQEAARKQGYGSSVYEP